MVYSVIIESKKGTKKMATLHKSGLTINDATVLDGYIESMITDPTLENVSLISEKIADLIAQKSDSVAYRNNLRTKIVKCLKEKLETVKDFPTLEHKKNINLYPVSYLYSRTDLSNQKTNILADTKTVGEKNLKREKRQAIDCQKLINMATLKLQSDDWKDIMVGLAILTGRRQVEIAYHAQFTEYDKNIILVTGILKKKEDCNDNATYRIPTLIDSCDIIVAVERLRTMCYYKFKDYTIEAIDVSEPKFNGNETKQLSNHLKTDDIAIYLESVTGENIEFRDFRTIYGSILFNYLSLNSNPDYAIGYTQKSLCHVSSDSTNHYLKYSFDNFPTFPEKMLNIEVLGLVAKSEETNLIEVKYTDLINYLSPIEINELLKLDVAKVLKLGLMAYKHESKKTGEPIILEQPKKYRGTNQTETEIDRIIDCMIRYNDSVPQKRNTVAFSVKSILEIYNIIFGRKIMESTIGGRIAIMQNQINIQIEKYGNNWGTKKVGNKSFYTNKHLGYNISSTFSDVAQIYRELNGL